MVEETPSTVSSHQVEDEGVGTLSVLAEGGSELVLGVGDEEGGAVGGDEGGVVDIHIAPLLVPYANKLHRV